ncbi:MAG: hypothetical protein U1F27_13070 [Turneriella sp.]
MAIIYLSKIVPVAARLKFRGVLEAAYLLRLLLQQKSNAEIRSALSEKFGDQWGRANQERRYFNLLNWYIKHHHEADYYRFLMSEDIRHKPADQRAARNALVRYLISNQGLHGGSEIINDLD